VSPAAHEKARVVLASKNHKKLAELRRILAEEHLGDDVEVVGADTYPDLPDVPETGVTFAENALLKARAVAVTTGLAALADDSGLCVDVLGGCPGVFSARWAGGHGDDAANLELLLAQIADVPEGRRRAHFACAVALARPDGTAHVVEGRVHGVVIHERRGRNGFGYDPIFVPDGEERTTAQLTAAEKDAISHRGRALRGIVPHLRELLA